MLISDRCGNKFEAVQSGVNGYLMDPYKPIDIKEKFHFVINRYKEFEGMGKKSLKIAKLNFEPTNIVKSFLENI